MLNATATLLPVPGPTAAVASCGLAEPGAAAGFAQALDRAATRSHEAGADHGNDPKHVQKPAGRPHEGGRGQAARRQPDAGAAATRGGAATTDGGRAGKAAAAAAAPPAAADAAALATTQADPASRSADAAGRDADEDAAPPPAAAEASPQDLAAWVSTLQLPPPPAGGTAADAGEDAAPPGRLARAETDPTGRRAAGRTDAARRRDGEASDAGVDAGLRPKAASALPPAAQAVQRPLPEAGRGRGPVEAPASGTTPPTAPAPGRDESPGHSQGPEFGSAMAALLAAPPATPARHTEAAPVVQAELRAVVGSEEFAPALGSQLSVFVRDGIEHAQLKLHPAELGPIEVRIDVEGGRAQVDFSAAQALTRQALQDAVPALASALREAGLTLTGGGVFEQPREQRGEARRDEARATTPAHGEPADAAAAAASRPRPTRPRGVVDLYA
jgi:hypothetical protein